MTLHNMNPFAWSGLLAGISSLSFGLLVLFKSPNRKLGWIWFLFTLSVAVWGFGVLWFGIAKSAPEGLLAVRVTYAFSVVWIASIFYHFVCTFLEIQKTRSIAINYFIALAFVLTLPTHFFFSGVRWVFGSMFYGAAGPLLPWFIAWWISIVFYSHYQLIQAYKNVSIQKRNQIKYFFFATAIGYTGGTLCYLPNFGIDVYPWGNFTVCIYPFIMSYAIVKHQLMDITVIIRKTLLYTLALVVGITVYIVFVAHFTHREILPLANFSIVTSILSFAMAVFVLFKAPDRKITLLWAATCFSIALWSFGFGMMVRSQTFSDCIFWQKWFLYVGAIFIPVFYLHFVTLLTGVDGEWSLPLSYSGALVFLVLNFSGYLATAKVKPPFNFYTDAIFPMYHAYTGFFLILAGYAHWLLFKRLRTAEGALRNQIQYVFLGTSIGFLGGAMTFPLSFNIHIFPIGTYLVSFYLVAVTYAIYKHQLMDINVVLRKSVVYSVMTAILTAIYLVVITQGTHLIQAVFGASTIAISIIAACLITAIFLPLRNWVQAFVDRYFFHSWSDREMVREVAAGFSHELKSPLAGLSMQAQLALADLEDVEDGRLSLQEALPKIKQGLHYLVTQSLDAARRIEAVRGVAEPSGRQTGPVDVSSVLDSGLATLGSRLDHAEVSVRKELPLNLPAVRSNEKQLEIVFINLMKNALEAMECVKSDQPHMLSIRGFEQNGFVLISIKDTGAGITYKDVDRIFDPYFTTKGHRGTGMGLYLSQQIIKAHRGSIEVKSEEGKGTEFIVRLPKYVADGKAQVGEAA